MKETDLRWQLRQLPREIELEHDLWPSIEAGIRRKPVQRSNARWSVGIAAAATLLLAGGLYWRAGAGQPAVAPQPMEARIVSREARAITDEYQAALRQFDGAPVSPTVEPSLAALDRSVAQIQSAIVADPDSIFLLDQLRRTYARRLELTQRAVTS
jgi:hypothetical protein